MSRKRKIIIAPVVLALIFSVCAGLAALPARAEGETAGLELSELEKSCVAAHPTLKIGYVQDRVPVSFTRDGDMAGIARYIFDSISQRCGIAFEYVPLPAGQVTYEYLLGQGLDLVSSVEYNEENLTANGILISQPYLSCRKVVVAKEGLEFSSAASFTVAVSTGSQTLHKVMGKMFPNFTLEDYESITDCLDAVREGEADLTIQNQYVAEHWIVKPIYEDLQVIPVPGLEDEQCFSAVVAFGDYSGPSQEDGRVLIGILNKAIAAMTEDETGTYIIRGVMENQYEFTARDFLYQYKYTVMLLGAALAVILVLMLLLTRQRIRYAEDRANARARAQFLSTMSHEIRTPLNGLIGLNYLMAQKLDDRETLNKYLDESTVTAKYLLSLVNDILDMSELQDRRVELSEKPVDLELLMNTVDSVVRGGMEEKGIRYAADIRISSPYILGDEARIQQVLLNLLDNARKFTPGGGNVTLTLRQEPAGDGAVRNIATVADTGCGMSEEFQKRIFDVFSQDLGTVSKGNQGTGLGLAISRSLVKLMGGELDFSSRAGEGTTFTFSFTSRLSGTRPAGNAGEPHGEGGAPARTGKILVAEDNELNGEILLELLAGEGFEADLAENGKIALDTFAASAPGTYGTVLMDLLMPEMDGFETAMAIRALPRPDAGTVRIYACTANAFPEDRERALAAGMDDFLTKPIDVTELMRRLES